jgi:transposase-like protein
VAEIARDLGINEATLGNWVNKAKQSGKLEENRSAPMSAQSLRSSARKSGG